MDEEKSQVLEPRWLFYLISFFIPVAGMVLGAIYMSRPAPEARDFGKKCLIAGVAYFAAACCCVLLYVGIYVVVLVGVVGTSSGGF